MHKYYQTASALRRLIANIIDGLLFIPLYILLSIFFSKGLNDWIFLILFLIYEVFFLFKHGATIGKKLVRVRVVSHDFKPISLGKTILRQTLGSFVSTLFLNLGYVWVILDKKNQGWHDKMARTIVLEVDEHRNFVPQYRQTSIIKRWMLFLFTWILISGLPIFLLIYLFVAQPIQINGQAMLPNYNGGEYYLVSKFAYSFNLPERGDVIVLRAPQDARDNLFVKRIVGLPKETIKIQNGSVYINGRLIEEYYLSTGVYTPSDVFLKEGQEYQIPDSAYIVLGDNRVRSSDSRSWGPVPRRDIVGKLWFKYAGR